MKQKPCIRITGESRLSVASDYVNISFDVTTRAKDYSKTLEKLSSETAELIAIAVQNGFSEKDIQTSNFFADKETRYDEQKQQQIFTGYRATQRLSVSFLADTDKINSLLASFASCLKDTDFSLSFFCNNPQKYDTVLIKDAVKCAKLNAQITAKAAGVTLGKILKINYDFSAAPVPPVLEYRAKALGASDSAFMPAMHASDTTLSKKVSIIWEIS